MDDAGGVSLVELYTTTNCVFACHDHITKITKSTKITKDLVVFVFFVIFVPNAVAPFSVVTAFMCTGCWCAPA
jgi:hypothetical protein